MSIEIVSKDHVTFNYSQLQSMRAKRSFLTLCNQPFIREKLLSWFHRPIVIVAMVMTILKSYKE